ncbi:alpha/beta fold hydrolase [Streptacidiphilus griseoplanus]|uniref:alpha/beta fold hydrolase n=1 Tax=Peterkaempfera griseoplana TaxID=66896 RepID=UPI0006E147CC|nr:alpha/beta hydrolase [Peterkaempfera griseoplana]
MTDRLSLLDSGTGTPLVLLHAFPLAARMWQRQLAELPGPDGTRARVLAPDLRGFGGAPQGDEAPSLDLLADDVARLLDRAGVERAVVGGLSMGGYVAMAFARRHGDRLSGLLLADTKATPDTGQARDNRERIARAVLARDSVQLLLDEQLPHPQLSAVTARERPEVVRQVRELMAQASPAAVAWAQRAMAARGDSLEVLAQVAVPALVVVGEEDAITPLADARAMTEVLADAELHTIPGAGHLTALEDPAAFNAAARSLLARTAAEPGTPPQG